MIEWEIQENDDSEEKEFVMPNAYCCGCGKQLLLKPMTLYVICGGCQAISQLLRVRGEYITMLYDKKKILRPTLISQEASEQRK